MCNVDKHEKCLRTSVVAIRICQLSIQSHRHDHRSQRHQSQRQAQCQTHPFLSCRTRRSSLRIIPRQHVGLEILILTSNNIPRRRILAHHKPTQRSHTPVRSPRTRLTMMTDLASISASLVALSISTVERSTANLSSIPPHQLGKMAGSLSEPRGFLIIIPLRFISPRSNGRGGIRKAESKVFTVGAALEQILR